MHCDIHYLLHAYRAAELHGEATRFRPRRDGLRHRAGWLMVDLGLRLAQTRRAPVRAARTA
ncbi:hypothetical protein [Streptomyces sp. B1I3]|uniref:hypothetical protein n=1 Tax=Streptomyces sp. B1I3 TaxID=3042264 RepID=UPI002782CEAB|nr:hypothetical protein [Streptomyces sp. B1I3]MDQ0796117.1 hypothetical protein [Streptomyces sp. B1I3]